MGLFDNITSTLDNTVNSATSYVSNSVNGIVNSTTSKALNTAQTFVDTNLTNVANVAANRLIASGLGNSALRSLIPSVGFNIAGALSGVTPINDWRVRISLPPAAGIFYQSTNPGVQWPLLGTSGAIFPYTPTVSMTHGATYNSQQLTHSNYMNYFYKGSQVSEISISGEFTVQNVNEGAYLMAVIEFFRSCTKMFFGQDQLAGNPPPLLYLDGYGAYYLPHVPCVVTSFNHTMPPDVDYIEIPSTSAQVPGPFSVQSLLTNSSLSTRLPTLSTIAITVAPIYSRASIHNNFTLTQFAAGQLISGAGGFI
jgi:hypothetical protein